MKAYAVILNAPDPVTCQRVRDKWPENFALSDTVTFIAVDDPGPTTSEVAAAIGMNNEKRVLGLVVEVGQNNFGFNSPGLWQWFLRIQP